MTTKDEGLRSLQTKVNCIFLLYSIIFATSAFSPRLLMHICKCKDQRDSIISMYWQNQNDFSNIRQNG